MADKDDVDSLNEEVCETKRKSRNLSEKKRRDSFNNLIKELANIVSSNSRKLDKSNILKQTIAFLRKNNRNETQADSGQSPNSEKFRPQFLSNEEYLYLLLENLEAFVIVVACNKQIVYASDKLKEILDIRQVDFRGKYLNDLLDDQSCRSFTDAVSEQSQHSNPAKSFYSFNWNFSTSDDTLIETKLEGKFKSLLLPDESCSQLDSSCVSSDETLCFLGVGRCERFPISSFINFPTNEKLEFVCKFNLEWKFIYLDQRSVNVIGYLPFELLGLSGYDFYHHDNLEDLALCHENIMKNGEATSPPYRFRVKADRWIWLKTKYSMSFNRWNTKPDCVVSTNYVLTDGVSFSTSDDRVPFSTTQLSCGDSTKPSVKYESLPNSCSKDSNNGDFGKQVFRPQPGVSIEHSPISTNSGKNQRKQKQQQTSNSTSKIDPLITEEANTELFMQLQQRQSNLQQQILQHERQLQTLHSQLLRSITPDAVAQQNAMQIAPPPLSPFSLQAIPRGQSIRPTMTSPRASLLWPSTNQHIHNTYPNPRLSF